jgi:hypothetical protein
VPGAPAAPAAVDPTTRHRCRPGAEIEDEKPTKANLLAEVAEVVQMAIDLNMTDQLPKIVKQYINLLDARLRTCAGRPGRRPGRRSPAQHAPPAARALPSDLSPSLFRILAEG